MSRFLTLNIGASNAVLAEYALKGKGALALTAYGEIDLSAAGEAVGSLEATLTPALQRVMREKGIKSAKPSFEGVRLVFPEGWALLRLSLHDPQMPLNIESRKKGGAKEIAQQVQELLAGFDALDFSVFNK